MKIEKIKSSIKSVKVISFDLFDTLFYRPYLNPNDLFYHLEMNQKRPSYANHRIITEKNTRILSSREEIKYDEIYDNIDENFRDMKDKELCLEFNSLLLNEEIKDLYDYAKSLEKKLIFISDMYLPVRFIEKLLNKFDINDVITSINKKMIRRNPHVFNNKNNKKYTINEIEENWIRIKNEEKN